MKKILIAEDNDSNYLLMTYILKNHYEALRARNGQEAVDMVETEQPDMVLMDLNMPVMGGLEATRLIKAAHPDLPIVVLSANAFDADREEAEKAGCDEYMAKPVSSKKCLETIAKFL